jgi:D-glycero-beta-D-manno-heptose 1-phosphate adenylyltransferase
MSFHSRLDSIVVTREKAKAILAQQRVTGKKIVFTNGVFDILHPGHVDYLSKARDMGDFLVLALNTDSSVQRLNKAPDRPLNTEQARAKVLASLACVDLIVLFDEDTPRELIALLKPDILVKGNDYKIEQIAGNDIVLGYGGEVKTVPLLEGYSTTALVKKIKG